MESVQHKLEKYRNKLMNETDESKIEFYNLKMQQYFIMQKQIQKGGDPMAMFGINSQELEKINQSTIEHIGNTKGDTVGAVPVEELLRSISQQATEYSNENIALQQLNKTLVKQLIELHRTASQIGKELDVNNLPSVRSVKEAFALFQPIKNVLVEYYVEELNKDNLSEQTIQQIVSELSLLDRESTIKEIGDRLRESPAKLPKEIKDILA